MRIYLAVSPGDLRDAAGFQTGLAHAAYRVGDEVDVVLEATMGMKAVFLAYFFPLLILLAVALAG